MQTFSNIRGGNISHTKGTRVSYFLQGTALWDGGKIDFHLSQATLADVIGLTGITGEKWKDSKRGFKSGICMMNKYILILSALNYNEL